MSNLSDAIQAVDTQTYKHDFNKKADLFNDVTKITSTITDDNVAKVYTIGATFACRVAVSELDIMADQYALVKATDNAKWSIVEAVFGEFRPVIRQLQNALYDNNVDLARSLVDKLESEMFKV